jgi:Copper transport outer membrane protein, MctB
VVALRNQAAFDDSYVAATAAALVSGRLSGSDVVLVIAPQVTPATVSAVSSMLTKAGAVVTGQVQLTAAWTDPGQQTVLSGIASQLMPGIAPAGTPGTPGTAGTAGTAATALAAAVVSTRAGAIPGDSSTALLAGLVQGGFLTVTGRTQAGTVTNGFTRTANMTVLLTPQTVPAGAVAGYVALGRALSSAGAAAVIAGPRGSATSARTGVIGALRADAAARAAVSGVDNVDLAAGRVAVILALVRAEGTGTRVGQYGQGPGATAPLPAAP